MPCKNEITFIDKFILKSTKKIFNFHLFYLKNARDWEITSEFIKRKIEREENKHIKLEV